MALVGARYLTDHFDGFLLGIRYFIMDRDPPLLETLRCPESGGTHRGLTGAPIRGIVAVVVSKLSVAEVGTLVLGRPLVDTERHFKSFHCTLHRRE